MTENKVLAWCAAVVFAAAAAPGLLSAQTYGEVIPGVHTGGSRNMKVMSHIPLGRNTSTADIEIEQELSRPYVYVARRMVPSGFDVISVKNPERASVIYSWRIENAELHRGAGSLNPMLLKSKGRYYLTTAYQFAQGGPDNDLGAIVHDVTGLPDTTKIREVARIKEPNIPGGFHETFAYKHSNGLALLGATTTGNSVHLYDIDKVAAGGDGAGWLVGRIPNPDSASGSRFRGYHDMYIAYDPANKRDLFYGAGYSGYFVFDISNLADPKLVSSISGGSGMYIAHTFVAEPTGRYALGEMEYQYAPVRVYDLKPQLSGAAAGAAPAGPPQNISRPIGAWIPQWNSLPHNIEIRWPYAFVTSYVDGFWAVNMMDPTNPYTVGYYYTCDCPPKSGADGAGQVGGQYAGAWGTDVRNADGLIVVSDMMTGFWALKMEGFDGWNGHQWGLPNVSSAQDWDNGPDGAPKPQKVS
ncbi:MAG: hypothetical protein HY700_12420 [Gemmatimonadetes bacterium]|nr:hypothetical protein [Gemmatimonadota bacterium]